MQKIITFLPLSSINNVVIFQAVLERGVLAYFPSRADACSGVKRKDFKYLDGARVMPLDCDGCSFLVNFSDSTVHRLSVLNCGDSGQQISRQVRYFTLMAVIFCAM